MIKVEVSGEGMIFRKEFDDRVAYTTTLSKKNKEGTWENAFISIQFKKDVFVHNKTKITLDNAWLTFYMSKDNKPVFYIFCNEFTEVDAPEVEIEPVRPSKKAEKVAIPSGFTAVEDDDCPF